MIAKGEKMMYIYKKKNGKVFPIYKPHWLVLGSSEIYSSIQPNAQISPHPQKSFTWSPWMLLLGFAGSLLASQNASYT